MFNGEKYAIVVVLSLIIFSILSRVDMIKLNGIYRLHIEINYFIYKCNN